MLSSRTELNVISNNQLSGLLLLFGLFGCFFFAVWAVAFFFLLFGQGVACFFFVVWAGGVFFFLLFGRGRVLFFAVWAGGMIFFAVWAGDRSSLTYPSAWLVLKRPNNKRDRTAKKNTRSVPENGSNVSFGG